MRVGEWQTAARGAHHARRFADIDEFLERLDEIPGAGTDPAELDPWEATKGSELPDGSVVLQVLGTGATARAFHVIRDGLESVLKVGRCAQAEDRLADEAAALEGLRHDHLVCSSVGSSRWARGTPSRSTTPGAHPGAAPARGGGPAAGPAAAPRRPAAGGPGLPALQADLAPRHQARQPRRAHPPQARPSLILFDFSLAGAPTSDVHAGTRGYRDPFLGTDRRPGYDEAAERYAAAVTLHEMAGLELPVWGDDGTDARFVDHVTVSAELFDPAVREPLTAFFRQALHRDAEQRFPSVGAMRQAWRQVFVAVDEEPPATSSFSQSDDPQELRDEAAERASADTALDASGLTLRAVALAQRLGANTVGELIKILQGCSRCFATPDTPACCWCSTRWKPCSGSAATPAPKRSTRYGN